MWVLFYLFEPAQSHDPSKVLKIDQLVKKEKEICIRFISFLETVSNGIPQQRSENKLNENKVSGFAVGVNVKNIRANYNILHLYFVTGYDKMIYNNQKS